MNLSLDLKYELEGVGLKTQLLHKIKKGREKKICLDEKKILVLYRLACLGFIMSAITIMVCIP